MFKLFSFHCPEKDSYMIVALSIRQWVASIQTAGHFSPDSQWVASLKTPQIQTISGTISLQTGASIQTSRQGVTSLQTGSHHARQPMGHVTPDSYAGGHLTLCNIKESIIISNQ